MSDRVQDLTNHRKVAVACKNYTDKEIKASEERILSIVARNNVDFIDHTDEPTYRFTAPANAKLLMLQAIGGNTVKLSPSVASDSTKALIKTMPSTVYTFDGSKFYGDSKVSENKAILTDTAQTTDRGVTYSISNGTINVNDSATANLTITLSSLTYFNGTYTFKNFGSQELSNNVYFVFLLDGQWTTVVTVKSDSGTITLNGNYVYGIAITSGTSVNGNIKPMLVVGSTAPTEWKQGFSDIHNIELSGLVVKNSDDEVMQTKTIDLTTIVDSNNNKLFPNGKLMGNTNVKDVLGVYNQESKWDEVDIGLQTIEATGIDTHTFKITLSSAKAPANNDTIANLLMANYTNVAYNNISTTDMIISLRSDNVFVIRNNAYSTAEAFKTAMSGVMLQYERATYLTSNTDLSATLRNIQGYPNGSIIAENTHNMDVESLITYNSIIQETLCPSVTVDGANRCNPSSISKTMVNNSTNVLTETFYLDAGTYTMKYTNTSATQPNSIQLRKEDNTAIFDQANNVTTFTKTFTITDSGNYKLTCWNINGVYNYTATCMLNEGSTAHYYRPYKPSITRNLPTQASDGYSAGTQRNYRVFCDDEGNEVSKRENNIDKDYLVNFNWSYSDSQHYFGSDSLSSVIKKPSSNANVANILSTNYTATSANAMLLTDKNISIQTNGTIGANNTLYTVSAIFKTAMANEPLYYELADASKTETDMEDFDFFFDVEEGDVITFNNPYAQQVYATYSFLIKEAKTNE